jgi:hypothetical protein
MGVVAVLEEAEKLWGKVDCNSNIPFLRFLFVLFCLSSYTL